MNKLSNLLSAAKAAPLKTTAIVVGTGLVIAGAVYGIKTLVNKSSEEDQEQAPQETVAQETVANEESA